MVTGMVVSLVHAYASVNMKANQSISGTAINMFAPAFAIFVARVVRNVQQIPFENQFRIEKVPVLGDIPVIGGMFFQNAYITTYLGILILVVSCVVLYKQDLDFVCVPVVNIRRQQHLWESAFIKCVIWVY